MKRIAFVIGLLTTFCSQIQAQSDYYIFVMADNLQPFYARLNDRIYSSSSIGHLVIPRLKDSTYNLYIGLPRKQSSEQQYMITIINKDLDLQLRPLTGDGWQLVNAQTAETVKPLQDGHAKASLPGLGERKSGGFAVLMSGLVNDSAVLYKSLARTEPVPQAAPVAVKSEPTKTAGAESSFPATTNAQVSTVQVAASQTADGASATIAASGVKDSLQSAQAMAGEPAKDLPAVSNDSSLAAKTTPPARSVVVQVQEWWNDKGKGFIYYDSTSTGMDTISLVIDFDKNAGLPTPDQVIAAPARVDSVKTAAASPDTAVGQSQNRLETAQSASKDPAKQTISELAKESQTSQTTWVPDTAAQKAAAVAAAVEKPATDSQQKTAAATGDGEKTNATQAGQNAVPKGETDSAARKSLVGSKNTSDGQAETRTSPASTEPKGGATIEAKTASTSPVTPKTTAPDTAETKTASNPPLDNKATTPGATTVNKSDAESARKDSVATSTAESRKSLLMMNSDCTNFANEVDVDKLRVKMLAATNTDDRIGVAKKVFKTKCFVTRYIRGLSELFPNDETRFRFFDAAYPYVSDSGNFRTLIDLFSDDLYIARFKALVRM